MTPGPCLEPAADRRAEYSGRAALIPTAVAAMLLLFGVFYFGGADERTTISNASENIGEQTQWPVEIRPGTDLSAPAIPLRAD